MPTYEYHCNTCNLDYEIDKPMAESGMDEDCPECDIAGRRVFSKPQLNFFFVDHSQMDGDKEAEAAGFYE